jgi:rhodanese-related sulfurtransferase
MTQPLDTELEVTTEHTSVALADGSAQVVDVREGYEREAGYIAGSLHIELMDLAAQADTLDRERPVIFHCQVGSRSLMAAQAFRRAGYDAWSMAGGLEAWTQEGRALEPAGGQVADH